MRHGTGDETLWWSWLIKAQHMFSKVILDIDTQLGNWGGTEKIVDLKNFYWCQAWEWNASFLLTFSWLKFNTIATLKSTEARKYCLASCPRRKENRFGELAAGLWKKDTPVNVSGDQVKSLTRAVVLQQWHKSERGQTGSEHMWEWRDYPQVHWKRRGCKNSPKLRECEV